MRINLVPNYNQQICIAIRALTIRSLPSRVATNISVANGVAIQIFSVANVLQRGLISRVETQIFQFAN